MSYFLLGLHVLILFGIALFIDRRQNEDDRPLFWRALSVKLLAGICLGLVYQHYYQTGDTFEFFNRAKEHADVFYSDPPNYFKFLIERANHDWKGSARSFFFVKIVSVFTILTGGNYWATSLWLSFISFLASLYLFRVVNSSFANARVAAAFSFFFFPSVLFWSSGVIKECIGLAALMILAGVFVRLMTDKKPRWYEWVLAAISMWIAWNLKYYWISVFLPVAVTSMVVRGLVARHKINSRLAIVVWMAVFFVLCLGASLLHPNFRAQRLASVVVENYQAFAALSDPSDLIVYHSLEGTWSSILLNAPWAIVSGLFRPFLWESDTLLKGGVALENVVIFILCLSSIGKLRHFFQSENRLLTLSIFVYVVVLCTFLALSTPNFGSLARYRVGFLPFLLFLVSYGNPILNRMLGVPGFRFQVPN